MKNAGQQISRLKKIIHIALGCMLLSGCALVVMYGHIWPDMKALQEADLSTCEIEEYTYTEAGQQARRAQLQLSAEDESRLREWLSSLKGMSVSHVTYAPGFYLRGKSFNILFRSKDVVVSFQPEPAATDNPFMHQVSRRMRPEDILIRDWLHSKLPAEPPTPRP